MPQIPQIFGIVVVAHPAMITFLTAIASLLALRVRRPRLQDGADDPSVLWMVGFAMWQLRVDPERALELYNRSLALNANCAQALTLRGWALATAGQRDGAIASLLQSLRLSPFDPGTFFSRALS